MSSVHVWCAWKPEKGAVSWAQDFTLFLVLPCSICRHILHLTIFLVSSSPAPKASNYLRMDIPSKLFADALLTHFLHLSSLYSAPLGEGGNEGRKDTDVRRFISLSRIQWTAAGEDAAAANLGDFHSQINSPSIWRMEKRYATPQGSPQSCAACHRRCELSPYKDLSWW